MVHREVASGQLGRWGEMDGSVTNPGRRELRPSSSYNRTDPATFKDETIIYGQTLVKLLTRFSKGPIHHSYVEASNMPIRV